MSSLSQSARVYFGSVLVAGPVALALVWVLAPPPGSAWLVITMLAAAVVSAPFAVRMPRVGNLSMAFVIVCASLLLLGTPTAALAAATAGASAALARTRQRVPAYRVAFNAFGPCLAAIAAGSAFMLAGGSVGFRQPMLEWPAFILAVIVFFFVNSGLVAGASSVVDGRLFLYEWRTRYLWTGPAFLAGGGVGAGLVLMVRAFGPVALFLSLPSLYVLHFSLKLYAERLSQEQRHGEKVADLYLSVIEALALAIDAKDRTTTRRLRRVQTFAMEIGRLMGLSRPDLEALRAGAVLHDIGKIAIPEYILCKPGRLTRDEFEKMATHPQIGAEILERIRFPYPLASVVRSHHEHFDGTGYPDGLRGESIPMAARILAVVISLEALTSERPYRRPLSRKDAIAHIRGEAGTTFDPQVVDVLIQNLERMETLAARGRSTPRVGVEDGHARQVRDDGIGNDTNALSAATMANISSSHQEVYLLYEIAEGMAASLNLDEALSSITSRIARLVHYRCLVVYLYDGDRRLLRARYVDGPGARRIARVEIREGERLSGWSARHRMPLSGQGQPGPANPDVPRSDLEDLLSAGVIDPLESSVAAPLLDGDELLGVLALYDLADRPYEEDHVRTLSLVTRHVASGVKNALLYERTQENALTDPLTQLPNARFLFSSFEKEIEKALRQRAPLSIIVLDVDHFKEVNDRFGHPAGDRILRGVARAIRSQLRPGDTCVRYAGDEFVLTVPGVGRGEIAAVQARVQYAIAKHKFAVARGKALRVTLSMGSATFPDDGQAMDALIAVADARMYDHKFSTRRSAQPLTTQWFVGRRNLPLN